MSGFLPFLSLVMVLKKTELLCPFNHYCEVLHRLPSRTASNITEKNDDIIFACRAIIPVYVRLSVYYGAMSGNVATRSTTPVQAICTNKIGLHHH